MADDKPIAWRPLVEGLAHAEKYSGSRLVAESDLRGLLRDGALPLGRRTPRRASSACWRSKSFGAANPEDPDRPIVALAPHWRENRLTRTLYPGRLRSSAQNYRPAPRRYDFVRIVIDMGRLRALMPLDASAKANPVEKTIRAAKPKPKLGLAEKWLRAAFPGLEPASIPRDVSAGEADRRNPGLGRRPHNRLVDVEARHGPEKIIIAF